MKRITFFLILFLILQSCEKTDDELNYSLIPGIYTGRMEYNEVIDSAYFNEMVGEWRQGIVTNASLSKSDGYNINISVFEDHYKIHFDEQHTFLIPDLEFDIDRLYRPPTKRKAYINLYENDYYTLHWLQPPWDIGNLFSSSSTYISIGFELTSRDKINKHQLDIGVLRDL